MKNKTTILLILLILLTIGCDKVDSCLDSGGCWDKVDKVCRKEEPNAQQLCNRTSSFTSESFLEDFEALRTHISKSYANLEYLLHYYKINPYELNKKTIEAIKSSKTEKDALTALRNFIEKFKDGHFRLVERTNIKADSEKSVEIELANNTPSKEACQALGILWDKKYGFLFPIDKVKVLAHGSGEFPYLVINKPPFKVGIIRIADFRDNVYPAICMSAWEKYRKSFKGKCNKECQESFQYYFLRDRIVDKFYGSLEEVRRQNINAIVLDLTNNGGGNDWVSHITALLTRKKIVCGKRGFVKHPHHVKNFKELLNEAISNPKKDAVEIKQLKENIKTASETCNIENIWTNKDYKPTCSIVGYAYGNTCKYDELNLHGKQKYSGRLFLLVNNNTASAAEDIVSRYLDSDIATVVGSRTHGSGCGYINGGIKFSLPNIGLEVKAPDCVRERADGTNEVVGLEPNIKLDMSKIKNSKFLFDLVSLVTSKL